MKKLVKTAKQQFDERLGELTLLKKYALSETDLYYLCENECRDMSILRKIHDKEFYEQRYNCSYSQLINHEEFLQRVTMRFIEHYEEPIKPLFDWYASADKTDEPFTLDDIWMCNLEDEDLSVIFSDIYEEIPDSKIITAKEQWEKDSSDSTTISQLVNGSVYKMKASNEGTDFYIYQDGEEYIKKSTCSLDELRKNGEFMSNYLSIVMDMHPEDMEFAIKWLKTGVYEMSDVSLMDVYEAIHDRFFDTIEYKDKERESIKKKDFYDDIKALKDRMIKHVEELFDEGMNIDFEWMCENVHTIGWEDGAYDYMDSIESFELSKREDVFIRFTAEGLNETLESRLSNLTINAIWSIICAMH